VVALVLLPSAIKLPQYQHAFTYIRSGFPVDWVLSSSWSGATVRAGITRLTGLAATVFFTCSIDGLAFNRAERSSLVRNCRPVKEW
jgi:hypothetical protein